MSAPGRKRRICTERIGAVLVRTGRAGQAAEFDEGPDPDGYGGERENETTAEVGRRRLPATKYAGGEPEQQDPPSALVAIMQPLDANREAGPYSGDEQDKPDEPDQKSRTCEAEQIVDVHSADPHEHGGDETNPAHHVDQNREPVFAAIDSSLKAEKQRFPVH